jgi:hypothetical protein
MSCLTATGSTHHRRLAEQLLTAFGRPSGVTLKFLRWLPMACLAITT